MGKNHRLGYDAERAVEVMWRGRDRAVMRPRAGTHQDVGDLVGLPIVQSIKNWNHLALAQWVSDLDDQVEHAGLETGVVWHKRRGKGSPLDWYVTTSGRLALPLLEAYCDRAVAL